MPTDSHRRAPWLAAAGGLLAACLACALLLGSFQWWGLRVGLPLGYVQQVCVSVRLAPRVQVSVTWISPYLSSVMPGLGGVGRPLCVFSPWLPVLPVRGGFVFP